MLKAIIALLPLLITLITAPALIAMEPEDKDFVPLSELEDYSADINNATLKKYQAIREALMDKNTQNNNYYTSKNKVLKAIELLNKDSDIGEKILWELMLSKKSGYHKETLAGKAFRNFIDRIAHHDTHGNCKGDAEYEGCLCGWTKCYSASSAFLTLILAFHHRGEHFEGIGVEALSLDLKVSILRKLACALLRERDFINKEALDQQAKLLLKIFMITQVEMDNIFSLPRANIAFNNKHLDAFALLLNASNFKITQHYRNWFGIKGDLLLRPDEKETSLNNNSNLSALEELTNRQLTELILKQNKEISDIKLMLHELLERQPGTH